MLNSLLVVAQGSLPGGFEHIIDVGKYSDWGQGYLTITDNHFLSVIDDSGKHREYYHLTFSVLESDGEYFAPNIGDIIIEVDGESAKAWTKEQFYSKVDGRHDTITIKIKRKDEGEILERTVRIKPEYELSKDLKPFGDDFTLNDITGSTDVQKRKRTLQQGTIFDERKDDSFDFFTCTKYNFLITSNNPLLDKDILKEVYFSNMKQDDESPDLLFTIARDADESISSTYIPPTSRTVNIGSKTRTEYNYITRQNDYVTTQKNKTIYEGGYTHESKTLDLFLEIAALDVKRINDKSITYPPIVWQATVKRHVSNAADDFDTGKNFGAWATWMILPPDDRYIRKSKTLYAPTGITCNRDDSKIIFSIEPESRAEKAGLKPGDKLLKIHNNKELNKSAKNNGWNALNESRHMHIVAEIQRDGKKIKLDVPSMSIKIQRKYCIGAK